MSSTLGIRALTSGTAPSNSLRSIAPSSLTLSPSLLSHLFMGDTTLNGNLSMHEVERLNPLHASAPQEPAALSNGVTSTEDVIADISFFARTLMGLFPSLAENPTVQAVGIPTG